ncbi:LOW QUALITY PROTEIN: cytochrome c oxidase subunit 5A, mitochondrial [Caloenas nicobarica]|uniref:LOW QUALITY PROTEIN: cytochrome c oxidase subunit 5A, mitochondrial n=1 Tax=Caloenas nicobarica TaxID=187106 RepID=UPI0032B71608
MAAGTAPRPPRQAPPPAAFPPSTRVSPRRRRSRRRLAPSVPAARGPVPGAAPAAMQAAAALLRRCALSGLRAAVRRPAGPAAVLPARCYSHGSQESDEEFDARWVTYFNKPDIDAWELRKGINTLVGYDLVPEPKIIDAALRACRRLNDFASAVRILEVVKDKAGPHKEIYPYVIQELRPTLSELGISTPEELGLDKA